MTQAWRPNGPLIRAVTVGRRSKMKVKSWKCRSGHENIGQVIKGALLYPKDVTVCSVWSVLRKVLHSLWMKLKDKVYLFRSHGHVYLSTPDYFLTDSSWRFSIYLQYFPVAAPVILQWWRFQGHNIGRAFHAPGYSCFPWCTLKGTSRLGGKTGTRGHKAGGRPPEIKHKRV